MLSPQKSADAKAAEQNEAEPKAEPAPVTLGQVIARAPEAAGTDWAEDLVHAINNSKDKKELYAAVVRRLGQEQGREVYHKIKTLR